MAKAAAKTSTKTPAKKTTAPRAKASNASDIKKVCEDVVQKLHELGIEEQLQRDLQWCLGSYSADGNPVGLYENAEKALQIFRAEKEKKTKGVTAKMITDLEKALQDQSR